MDSAVESVTTSVSELAKDEKVHEVAKNAGSLAVTGAWKLSKVALSMAVTGLIGIELDKLD